ncbi:hypothetical protein HA051_09110 [Chromobacterium vaccinii]|nr:hypothetical protein [Chromobacterium vaccinii]
MALDKRKTRKSLFGAGLWTFSDCSGSAGGAPTGIELMLEISFWKWFWGWFVEIYPQMYPQLYLQQGREAISDRFQASDTASLA